MLGRFAMILMAEDAEINHQSVLISALRFTIIVKSMLGLPISCAMMLDASIAVSSASELKRRTAAPPISIIAMCAGHRLFCSTAEAHFWRDTSALLDGRGDILPRQW